jgi:hypothetical protein
MSNCVALSKAELQTVRGCHFYDLSSGDKFLCFSEKNELKALMILLIYGFTAFIINLIQSERNILKQLAAIYSLWFYSFSRSLCKFL